ncbi:MAG: hypothetical protein ACO1OB_31815 [Archangium sp.]
MELVFLIPGIAVIYLAFRAEGLRRFVALPAFVLVLLAALLTPLKWRDLNTRSFADSCVPMSTFAPSLPDAKVCFSSRTPTYREVEDVLRGEGVTMDFGYCGNGATVLFGMHPDGAPRFTLASNAGRSTPTPAPLR